MSMCPSRSRQAPVWARGGTEERSEMGAPDRVARAADGKAQQDQCSHQLISTDTHTNDLCGILDFISAESGAPSQAGCSSSWENWRFSQKFS